MLIFYVEGLLATRPTLRLEYLPLSAVRYCLFSILATTLRVWEHLRVFVIARRPWFVFSVRCKMRLEKKFDRHHHHHLFILLIKIH
jgi:hypothetical protein